MPKEELARLIMDGGFIQGAQPAPMQDSHKLAYTVPFEESIHLSGLLSHIEESYPALLVDIETATLESAYLRIIEAQARLGGNHTLPAVNES